MPAKRSSAKKRRGAAGKKSAKGRGRAAAQAQPGLLIEVARTIGSTLGTLAARSEELHEAAVERLRAPRKRR